MYAEIISGKGTVLPATVSDSGDFLINIQPVYPPKSFGIMVYYKEENQEPIQVINKFEETVVTTTFDWTKTQIHGKQISGGKVNDDLTFDVLLYDVKGYCYFFGKEVSVIALGPYASKDLSSTANAGKNPIQMFTLNVNSMITEDESCNQYTVDIPAETFTKTGFYEI